MFDKNQIELHRIKSQPGRSTTSWENGQSQLLLNSTYIPNLRNLNLKFKQTDHVFVHSKFSFLKARIYAAPQNYASTYGRRGKEKMKNVPFLPS